MMLKIKEKLFFKALAVIYFLAFLALLPQVRGLYGSNGIYPFAELSQNFGGELISNFVKIPSLFWISTSDWFIYLVCLLGLVFSILFFLEIFPVISLVYLQLAYCSYVNFGQEFMSFQWDVLLLETGFLSLIFYIFRNNETARRIIPWLFKLLIFKLMLMSGLVKLASNDASWRDLTALSYHYYTQPIPNPPSFYIHQLPLWFHKLSCGIMFLIELVLPLLIFFGTGFSNFAGLAFIALMLVVILTGNYNFFNLLTIALSIWLIDDALIQRFIPESFLKERKPNLIFDVNEILNLRIHERIKELASGRSISQISNWISKIFIYAVTAFLMILNFSFIASRTPFNIKNKEASIRLTQNFLKKAHSYHLASPYGLFANMTEKRLEIVIQGADEPEMPFNPVIDEWLDYEFKYKPGDINRMPPQIAPLHPRLDWQMWFAALSNYKRNPWFLRLCVKLLNNETEVLDLLEHNPFPNTPPKYIRALAYSYKYNDLETYQRTGEVWKREYVGVYMPQISLKN